MSTFWKLESIMDSYVKKNTKDLNQAIYELFVKNR